LGVQAVQQARQMLLVVQQTAVQEAPLPAMAVAALAGPRVVRLVAGLVMAAGAIQAVQAMAAAVQAMAVAVRVPHMGHMALAVQVGQAVQMQRTVQVS
jgi:hypothetical protein